MALLGDRFARSFGSRIRSAVDGEVLALLALGALLITVLEPILIRGHVLTADDNRAAYGVQGPGSEYPRLPGLGDVDRFFIPKLNQHFNGDTTGWSATWNPHIQLGKPVSHFGGYSKAYPITYLLSFGTKDPYRLHAWISVITLTLLTFFSFFFLRSLDLHPAAAFIGAIGIGLNTRSAYWLGFAQFLSWTAWSLAILWLIVVWTRRRSPAIALALVFCCYCLAIGARHQATIRIAYLVVPFVLLTVWAASNGWRQRAVTLLQLATALGLALVLAFPLLHDMAGTLSQSERMAASTEGFIMGSRAPFLERTLPMLWNTFAFGNPSRQEFPFKTSALSFNPFFFALLAVAFVARLPRRAFVFIAVFGFFLAMTVSPAFHLFAVKYLGFGFSRGSPEGGLYIPGFVLCAFAADRLLRARSECRTGAPVLAAALFATVVGVITVLGTSAAEHVEWSSFAQGLALAAMAVVFVWRRSAWILYAVAVLVVSTVTRPAMIHRPMSDVVRSSALSDLLGAETRGGYRFAKFGAVASLLPSNQEVLVDLRSIHSYDSVASMAYGRWTRTISKRGTQTHGRHFVLLDDLEKLTAPGLSYSGLGVILSDRALPMPGWKTRKVAPGQFLHVAPTPPLLIAQVEEFELVRGAAVIEGSLEEKARPGWARELLRRDDLLKIRVRPTPRETLLFVSSQFHRDWRARAGRAKLRVVRVNDFYLGVVLDAGTREVELRFEPLAQWAWVPLLLFGFALPVVVARERSKRS